MAVAVEQPDLEGNVVLLEKTKQVEALQTILLDRRTEHSQFVFYADRLMRIVVEEALNQLPTTPLTVTTPTHCKYKGLGFARGNCGVSLCRSGEAMEIALRQCARSIRICKMLIGEEKVLYARLTGDMASRRVLLLYPIVSTGSTVVRAIAALRQANVAEDKIFLVTLFAHPTGVSRIQASYPDVTIIVSDISTNYPHNFAMKYFGTD